MKIDVTALLAGGAEMLPAMGQLKAENFGLKPK